MKKIVNGTELCFSLSNAYLLTKNWPLTSLTWHTKHSCDMELLLLWWWQTSQTVVKSSCGHIRETLAGVYAKESAVVHWSKNHVRSIFNTKEFSPGSELQVTWETVVRKCFKQREQHTIVCIKVLGNGKVTKVRNFCSTPTLHDSCKNITVFMWSSTLTFIFTISVVLVFLIHVSTLTLSRAQAVEFTCCTNIKLFAYINKVSVGSGSMKYDQTMRGRKFEPIFVFHLDLSLDVNYHCKQQNVCIV